jgi:hypothetical protein
VIVTCEQCGKAFNRAPSLIKRRVFCSKACMGLALRGTHFHTQESREKIRRWNQVHVNVKPLFGPDHPNWSGEEGRSDATGRRRARQRFPLTACEVCGRSPNETRIEHHHKDGNPRNNAPDNVQILCSKDHKAAERARKARKEALPWVSRA